MGLSSELISQFVKITNDSKRKPKETTVYGTVKSEDGKIYVQMDGSSLLTPVIATTTMKEDDRVTVMIKNHSAIVTGNLSSPSASNKELLDLAGDLGVLGGDVSEALGGITGAIGDINTELGDVNSAFDLLVKTVGEINDNLEETGKDVSDNASSILDIKNDLSSMGTKISNNTSSIAGVRNDLANTNKNVSTNAGNISTNASNITQLRKDVDNIQTVNAIKKLTSVRIDNPYISDESFKRLTIHKVSEYLAIINFNILISTMPKSSDWITIGYINGISLMHSDCIVTLSSQNGSGVLLVQFFRNNNRIEIRIYNGTTNTITDFVRGSIPIVCTFS